ncbi:hypothetical protein LEL_03070 [Akanthomyces lecanii RCEF 1005]|uniref:Uncharacterized protein n=1 Tax=Akanthomyces lecanii RCEF 1005 TaxID=1081108 RepID=A0A168IRN3_CORDF|nr:hypothetical protein LEL_03070 [Akanthomyces lecanii RCEF 1005]
MASTLEVQRILVDAFQGCTVLSIAHWDSPIQKPDLKLEIVNGKLVSALRADVEADDEEAAEKRLEEMERCMKDIDRLRLKEDAEQRQILERERAFEAKMNETALKSRYTTAQMLLGPALDTLTGSDRQEALPGRLTSRIPATLLDVWSKLVAKPAKPNPCDARRTRYSPASPDMSCVDSVADINCWSCGHVVSR